MCRTDDAYILYPGYLAGRPSGYVHNLASATNPGGGVVNEASAQEEALCRGSTRYFSLDVREMRDGFYSPRMRDSTSRPSIVSFSMRVLASVSSLSRFSAMSFFASA